MSQYKDAAARFRALLGSEHYPVGTIFSGIEEVMRQTGANRGTAHRALRHLAALGEVRILARTGTEVLPPPVQDPRKVAEALMRDTDALRESVSRLLTALNRAAP